MRSMICLMFALGGCVAHVDSEPVPAQEDAGAADAQADGDGAVSLCGDVILQQQKHPEAACATDGECVTKAIGNACICGLCVTSY